MLTKCLGHENLELTFRAAPKSIWGPLHYTDYSFNRKKHITGDSDIKEDWYGILITTYRKEHGIKHVGSVVQLHHLESKANFVVKVVVLDCCEKTVCLLPEIRVILNSGQKQRKYKSGIAKRNLRVEKEKRDEQSKKKMPFLLTWI